MESVQEELSFLSHKYHRWRSKISRRLLARFLDNTVQKLTNQEREECVMFLVLCHNIYMVYEAGKELLKQLSGTYRTTKFLHSYF